MNLSSMDQPIRCTPLPSPDVLRARLPVSSCTVAHVRRARDRVRAVFDGADDRLVIVAGPCSVHDPVAALEYGALLAAASRRHEDDLLLVMRAYGEKPRTVAGWKGLISDPAMDGSCDVEGGLRIMRQLLLDLAGLAIPVACEWLEPATPYYLADLVTWASVGARTTESQVHRQLASGLSMPVGFKNSTDGDIQVAVEACIAAARPHTFLGISGTGRPAAVTTVGNPDCHIVLRGGRAGPNYAAPYVRKSLDLIEAAGLPPRLMIDASHGNSERDYRCQPHVAAAVADQVASGDRAVVGLMLESFLRDGRQEPGPVPDLVYGQSVTDPCLDWQSTAEILAMLACAVRERRKVTACRPGT
jgi:3-deoxy-7-phosphoheptulonate synthase